MISHQLKPIHCMARTTPDSIIQDELKQTSSITRRRVLKPTIYFELHLP